MKQLMKFLAQKKSPNKYTWYMETHFCRFIYKLRASLCKILISSLAHKMDFAHNVFVDFV